MTIEAEIRETRSRRAPTPEILHDDWMYSAKETSRFVRRSTSSLAKDRYNNRGLPYHKVGKLVAYRGADIRAALASCRVDPEGHGS